MSTAHNLSTLTRTARALGVTLPGPVADALAAEHGLPALADVEADTVREIAEAVGRKDFPKVRDAALDRLARATAASRVWHPLDVAIDAGRWSSVVLHGEEILDAFRVALADDLAALNTSAPLVPVSASPITGERPSSSAALSPEAYEARLLATRAAERLDKATTALAPLFRIGNGPGITTANVQRRMMLVAMPEDLDRATGQEIARGLMGSRLVSISSDTTATSALWWAVVAAQGVTFRLASPEEFRETFALMREAVRVPALGEVPSAGLVL